MENNNFYNSKIRVFFSFFLVLSFVFLFSSCSVPNAFKPKKVDRDIPANAKDRARKNVEEGRGISIMGAVKGKRGTNYEFSTSNPLWRATLDVLDFLPLSTVDYSGGVIITDWYSDNTNEGQALKITVRFLSNVVQTNSVKVVVHRKKCSVNQSCKIDLFKSRIQEELVVSILREAALLEKQQKNN